MRFLAIPVSDIQSKAGWYNPHERAQVNGRQVGRICSNPGIVEKKK